MHDHGVCGLFGDLAQFGPSTACMSHEYLALCAPDQSNDSPERVALPDGFCNGRPCLGSDTWGSNAHAISDGSARKMSICLLPALPRSFRLVRDCEVGCTRRKSPRKFEASPSGNFKSRDLGPQRTWKRLRTPSGWSIPRPAVICLRKLLPQQHLATLAHRPGALCNLFHLPPLPTAQPIMIA